ncbi:MAG: Spo0B domain-containing protein [Lachnospiraceae bacterium]|nr:Spo0B domain-containing protein [Lachnospiraceae bacterium]
MSVRKLSRMLLFVNGVQFVLGAGILIGLWSDLIAYTEEMLDLSIFLVLFSSLLSIAGLFSLTRYQQRNYTESMENLENLNAKLREQRHDYLNQVQIVHGLLELGEYEEARDYLRPVFKDIMKVNRALKTAQPAVNALLQAKMEAAEQQGIDFYLEVGTQLKELSMEAWELCKILANLIDNAVTAVSQNEGEKRIKLQIEENRREYLFLLENNGPGIPQEQRKLIFSRGYTTKKGEGHGMGLAIVVSILREAGSSIHLESSEEETVFSFIIPRQKAEKHAVSSEAKNDRLKRKMYK